MKEETHVFQDTEVWEFSVTIAYPNLACHNEWQWEKKDTDCLDNFGILSTEARNTSVASSQENAPIQRLVRRKYHTLPYFLSLY